MKLRVAIGLAAIVVVTIALVAAQVPYRTFVWNADTCCCHHAGPCPCPGHQIPHHEGEPAMHACGSGGHDLLAPTLPGFDVPPTTAHDVAVALVAIAHAPPTPHAPPELDRRSGPS